MKKIYYEVHAFNCEVPVSKLGELNPYGTEFPLDEKPHEFVVELIENVLDDLGIDPDEEGDIFVYWIELQADENPHEFCLHKRDHFEAEVKWFTDEAIVNISYVNAASVNELTAEIADAIFKDWEANSNMWEEEYFDPDAEAEFDRRLCEMMESRELSTGCAAECAFAF